MRRGLAVPRPSIISTRRISTSRTYNDSKPSIVPLNQIVAAIFIAARTYLREDIHCTRGVRVIFFSPDCGSVRTVPTRLDCWPCYILPFLTPPCSPRHISIQRASYIENTQQGLPRRNGVVPAFFRRGGRPTAVSTQTRFFVLHLGTRLRTSR